MTLDLKPRAKANALRPRLRSFTWARPNIISHITVSPTGAGCGELIDWKSVLAKQTVMEMSNSEIQIKLIHKMLCHYSN